MVPSLASRHVIERWATFAPILLAGARAAIPESYLARRPLGEATGILIEASALAELGRQGKHDERYVGALGGMTAVSASTLTDAVQEYQGTGLILDATGFMPALIEGFVKATTATEQELANELDGLRFSERR